MDQARLRETEARCTQESVPHCRGACPLQLDVRAFMEALAAGKQNEARKILERHLPLPALLAQICDHPCENHCLRRDLGGSMAISALESFCVNAVGPQTHPLPRSPRQTQLAVLGNGLAGLVVAYELSRKAFPVTLFHSGEIGDTLHQRFPALTEESIKAELDSLQQGGVTFEKSPLDATTLKSVRAHFAAVFIDADAAPHMVAERETVEPDTLEVESGLCCGGWLEHSPTGARYASASRQAGDGRRAAVTLERCMTGVSLTVGRKDTEQGTKLYTPLDTVPAQARVLPQGINYTDAEAIAEASRCIRCECLACVRDCVYLQKFRGYPRTYARQVYNNAAIVKGQHAANPLINGCTLCGQCTELCPERFSMADLCLEARQDMVKRNYMPPSAHEFALEDMDNALSSASVLCRTDPALPAGQPCSQVLFPGCQLAASRGEQVLDVYRHLRGIFAPEGLGLFLSCCGVPAHWAGQEQRSAAVLHDITRQWEALGKPRMIMACASCLKHFREFLPQIPVISLWEILDTCPSPSAQPEQSGDEKKLPAVCTIHDPCSARHDMAWQQAVRSLARRHGIRLTEPSRTGVETACCGYGGLVWNAQPELADAMAAQRAAALPDTALASCIMCRDRLVATGKACFHMLDILFPSVHNTSAHTKGPGLSERRRLRAALRTMALQEFWGETVGDSGLEHVKSNVQIPPEVLEALERKHILREDVEQAVQGVEATHTSFVEQHSGHVLGAWRPRHVTFWVEYSRDGAQYTIHDAWCHRMIVPGAGTPSSGALRPPDEASHDAAEKTAPQQCCTEDKV